LGKSLNVRFALRSEKAINLRHVHHGYGIRTINGDGVVSRNRRDRRTQHGFAVGWSIGRFSVKGLTVGDGEESDTLKQADFEKYTMAT
jgi:hypothetical protein